MELLLHELLSNRLVHMGLLSSCLEFFELLQVFLFFSKFHAIVCRQLTLIFSLELVDSSWLDVSRHGKREPLLHTALVLNEAETEVLDIGHAKNVDDVWPLLLILD